MKPPFFNEDNMSSGISLGKLGAFKAFTNSLSISNNAQVQDRSAIGCQV
ncbi:hypothetical protein [Prevotella sp.]|nr:hypothetical protein [Prevotella sp.]